MKNWLLFFRFFTSSTFIFCQTIYIYDLENGTMDSIVSFPIDTTLTSAHSNYYEGLHSLNIAPLSDVFPTMNTFPQSEYALKKRVELDYSIGDYPIRTAVRSFCISNGEDNGICSGTLISRTHVITAAHCHFHFSTKALLEDTFYVCPAYNNGTPHPDFGCFEVGKIFVLKNWMFPMEDICILELKENVGYETGWTSVGFQEDSTTMVNQMHYKFSYPADYVPLIDSNVYNGDTMYYNYGKINYVMENSMGVYSGNGIPGESGSSLIHVENDLTYTVYGIFSHTGNMSHTRITNKMYHFIHAIIEDDLNVNEPDDQLSLIVYPNPANEELFIKSSSFTTVRSIQNSLGQKVSNWQQDEQKLDIAGISPGIYFVELETQNGTVSRRFVKQ